MNVLVFLLLSMGLVFADVHDHTPEPDCEEAKNHPELIKVCREAGFQNMINEATRVGATVTQEQMFVCDVDANRRFATLTGRFVWYCANTDKGRLQVMVQKPLFRNCF